MPSEFPRSPRLLKGALVAYQSQFLGQIPNVIVFQYNPDQLRRTLSSRSAAPEPSNVGAAREDVQREMGPPVETINLTIELDATDQLEFPELHLPVVTSGLHPALAALELLLYPASEQVLLRQTQSLEGTARICPTEVPLVLFVWGSSRVLPVRITSFSVTEKAFDPNLNPIQAEVELGMKVLTYAELEEGTLGYDAYMATQTQKETLARLNLAGSTEHLTRGLFPF